MIRQFVAEWFRNESGVCLNENQSSPYKAWRTHNTTMEQSNSLDLLSDGYALCNSLQVPTTCTSPFLPSEKTSKKYTRSISKAVVPNSYLEYLIK